VAAALENDVAFIKAWNRRGKAYESIDNYAEALFSKPPPPTPFPHHRQTERESVCVCVCVCRRRGRGDTHKDGSLGAFLPHDRAVYIDRECVLCCCCR
jgi:hypothetical protein